MILGAFLLNATVHQVNFKLFNSVRIDSVLLEVDLIVRLENQIIAFAQIFTPWGVLWKHCRSESSLSDWIAVGVEI